MELDQAIFRIPGHSSCDNRPVPQTNSVNRHDVHIGRGRPLGHSHPPGLPPVRKRGNRSRPSADSPRRSFGHHAHLPLPLQSLLCPVSRHRLAAVTWRKTLVDGPAGCGDRTALDHQRFGLARRLAQHRHHRLARRHCRCLVADPESIRTEAPGDLNQQSARASPAAS